MFLLTPLLLTAIFIAATSADELKAVEAWLEQNTDANLQRRIEFISIPSVSSDPDRAHEVRRAGEWLMHDLKLAGMENIEMIETKRHPTVYADWLHAKDPDAPTILIYAHFDVQPEDPIGLWTTPPFTPTVRDGNLYARGASDDKGHLYVPLVALRAYLNVTGELPVNVKLLLEGEEEIGSPNMPELLSKHKEQFQADYAFSADGGQISTTIPGLCIGLRGCMALEVKLTVGDTDMHSGSYGGGVRNPNIALANLLTTLHDQNGQIAVEGFYDDVDVLTDEDRKDIAKFPESDVEHLAAIGVNATVGEDGYSFYERTWARPALDVVGMWGGFTGKGIKTVLPREASAKISSRLVPSQTPEKAIDLIIAHLKREVDKLEGVSIDIQILPFRANPYKTSKNTVANVAARNVLTDEYGREPVFFRMGGSIPVMPYLQEYLNLETTMFAFGHSDENVHAPNEFARLDSFLRGEKAYVRLFKEISVEHKNIEGKSEL